MKILPDVGKKWLLVLFLVSIPLFLLAAPAHTEIDSQCLVSAGVVPLDGVEGRFDHLTAEAQGQRLFVSGLENHTI